MTEKNNYVRESLLFFIILVIIAIVLISMAFLLAYLFKKEVETYPETISYQKTYNITSFSPRPIENIDVNLSDYYFRFNLENDTSFTSFGTVTCSQYSWTEYSESSTGNYTFNFNGKKSSNEPTESIYWLSLTINDSTTVYNSFNKSYKDDLPEYFYNIDILDIFNINGIRYFQIQFNVIVVSENKLIFNNYIFNYNSGPGQTQDENGNVTEYFSNDIAKYFHDLYMKNSENTCPFE